VHDPDRLIDPATGLSTEWHFDIVLDFIFPLAHRGVTLTLVLFGIDEGARGSDDPPPKEVISDLGSAIGGVIRSSDLVARYGEDLFMCLLPVCNLQGGLVFADRIRDALEDFTARTGATVSAGVASHRGEGEGTRQEMVQALKAALMEARAAGGNRVEICQDAWNV
jgi:diguanylate cyclase (GGDEF)-like protein